MHAWAEVCHLSQSSKSVLTGFLSRCMVLTEESLTRHLIKHKDNNGGKASHCLVMHTNPLLIQWMWVIITFCETSKLWKSNELVHCSVLFGWKPLWKSCNFEPAHLKKMKKKKKEEHKNKNVLANWWLYGLALLWCSFAPLGILLVIKTLEDEWYIVINAYKFTFFLLSCI